MGTSMTCHVEDFFLASSDGIHQLRIRHFFPDGKVLGVVQLVHGISEHIERYDDFAGWLARRGFAVVGDDHLGHGKTAAKEELGHTTDQDGWNYMVEDERIIRRWISSNYPGLPVILLGHSMGSFLSRHVVIHDSYAYHGLILSGTGQQPVYLAKAGLFLIRTLRLIRNPEHKSPFIHKLVFGAYNKKIENPRTVSDWLSTDDAVVNGFIEDPLCGVDSSLSLISDLLTGVKTVCRPGAAKDWRKDLPVLLLSGSEDPVGDYGIGVQRAYEDMSNSGIQKVSMKLYDDMRHEILNEINRKEVYEDILEWIHSLTEQSV